MKTIFITISRGALIRNFFHTGVIPKLLERNIRVVVLTPYHNQPELFKPYFHKNLIFEPLLLGNIRWHAIFKELMKGAVFNKTVLFLSYRLIYGEPPNLWLLLPRLTFLAPLRIMPGFKRFIRWLELKINPQREHDYLFEKYRPQAVFITSVNDYIDSGVTKSARRFGFPSVGMAKSWDNISKALFNAKTDYLLVWSPFMKYQAIKYQGYRRHEIFVSGVPQFDIYHQTQYLLSREEFCASLGLDPNKKIILYGSIGGGPFIDMEADYPEMIQHWINEGKLSGVQLLVRPHVGYRGEVEKFARLEKYPNIVVDKTDKRNYNLADYWDVSFNHLAHLYNTFYHCDVCVNIASTLTLDATACGKQVINIKFDRNPNVDFNHSARRLHRTDYVTGLMDLGATWVVESHEEFLAALKSILEHGARKDTKRLIDYFLYKNDGKATERIVSGLLSIMDSKHIKRPSDR